MQASKKQDGRRSIPMRRLPFFVEFVKFSAAFCVIIATALLTLHVASAAMQ